MKTFREFVFIAEDRMGQRLGNMSDADFEQFLKGRTPGESQTYREKRAQFRRTNVSGQDVRGSRSTQTPPRGTQTPPRQPSGSTQTQTPPRGTQTPPRSTQTPPRQSSGSTQTQTPPRSTQTPPRQPSGAQQAPSSGRNPNPYRNTHYTGSGGAGRPPSGPSNLATTPPKSTAGPGLRSRLGKLGGTALNVGAGALEYKDRRSAGQSRTQAATGAAASTAGSEAGWRTGLRLGSSLGARIAGPRGAVIGGGIGALGGSVLGSSAAGGLSDKLTGASKTPTEQDYEKARQKYGVTQSRKVSAQSGTYGAKQGSGLSGIGGQTFTSRDKKGSAFMSTGAGSQRKTVQLAKTQLVRDPKSGKQVVGDLAFKNGQATYLARPSVASRDTGLGGAFRNLSRSTGIGGQRERDAAAAKQEYRTALKNTQTYQKKLGITPKAATAQKLPGQGVGPKKVGPKIVGPKKVGPAKPQATPGSSAKPA